MSNGALEGMIMIVANNNIQVIRIHGERVEYEFDSRDNGFYGIVTIGDSRLGVFGNTYIQMCEDVALAIHIYKSRLEGDRLW